MADSKSYIAYADGSCIGNPGPGGWGVVIIAPDGVETELSGHQDATTNNRMEITAAIEALRAIPDGAPVIVRSDSQYVVKTMNDGWRRRENVDLWPALDNEARRHRTSFEWVRGHASDALNERADGLARRGATGKPDQKSTAAPSRPVSADKAAAKIEKIEKIESMLLPDEKIAACAGCGRKFVAAAEADYCSLVECQIKSRTAPSKRGT